MTVDPKLITEYLVASGVTAICIVKEPKGFGYAVGRAAITMARTVATHWVEKPLAGKVARLARTNAGRRIDRATVERSLQRAAWTHGARLTPNNIVISRATDAAARLESYLSTLNDTGGLADFNAEYKRRRKRATARGENFISFSVATARLRRALIKVLIEKRQIRMAPMFFEDVFR